MLPTSYNEVYVCIHNFYGATVPSGPGAPHYGGFTITLRHIQHNDATKRNGRHKNLHVLTSFQIGSKVNHNHLPRNYRGMGNDFMFQKQNTGLRLLKYDRLSHNKQLISINYPFNYARQ